MKCVDPIDLSRREAADVRNFYLPDWFRTEQAATYFNPPAFYLRNGCAFFINGRHRAILLGRHLSLVPMALTQLDTRSQSTLANIAEREIAADEEFDLPDLPISRGNHD
jgi:hypothetical protein